MRLALSAICAFALLSPAAVAGDYTVYACRSDDSGQNSSWRASASSSHVAAYNDGCGSSGGGLVARAGVEATGSFAAAFDSATWRFDAPTGSSISQVSLSGRLYRASGGRWGVGLSDQGGNYLLGGISADAMAWESGGYVTVATPASTTLYFGVICANGSGCPTSSTGQPAWGYSRARADLYGARVRVSDTTPPSIGPVRGSLVGGTWVGGPASVGFDASDSVGVASQSFAVAGLSRSDVKDCNYSTAAPCPTPTGSDFTVDTRSIPDGAQTLTLSATDTAGNLGSSSTTVYIDNNVPGPPSQPVLQGAPASSWRSENGFSFTYENPSRAGGAPLTSHDVQVCPTDTSGNVDTSACSFDSRPGAPGADAVTLPRAGRFRMRVRVNDFLYAGAWSPWSDLLRFDDIPPGSPSVTFPVSWINARLAAGGLGLSTAAARTPVSGISGYIIGGLGAGDLRIEASSTGAASLLYALLPEGETRLSVRALSGSGLLTDPGAGVAGTVRKDTVAPSLSVTGAPDPGATVTRDVTLAASGSDPVSGMTPAPADRPVTDGAFVAFAAPGGAIARIRGGYGEITPGEGRKSFAITATDTAGNESPATQVAYTQDTRVPTGGLLPAPAEAPATIRFLVSESCAGTTIVELSSSPGEWSALPTVLSDGVASARVPSAIWAGEAPYTLRAGVTDCAGNQATLDRWAAGPLEGQPIGQLTPPRRTKTTARAAIARQGRGAHASSTRRTLNGIVRTADGRPLAGAQVLVETQPRATGQQWRSAATATSSRSGRLSEAIENRHSQLIRISVAETDLLAPSFSNVVATSVKASSSISAHPRRLGNGRRVTLSGRLRGGYVPRSFEISLYGRSPGSRSWVPVRTPVAVARSGRWKVSYRFSRTRVRTTYRFRVRIPPRPDYPFARGYSSSRAVTVVP